MSFRFPLSGTKELWLLGVAQQPSQGQPANRRFTYWRTHDEWHCLRFHRHKLMICMVKGRNQFEVIVLFAYPTENILRTADRSAKISKNTTRYFYKYFNMTDFKWVSQIFLCQLLPLSQPLGKSFSPSQRTVAFPICKLKFKSKKSKTLFFQEQSDLIIII